MRKFGYLYILGDRAVKFDGILYWARSHLATSHIKFHLLSSISFVLCFIHHPAHITYISLQYNWLIFNSLSNLLLRMRLPNFIWSNSFLFLIYSTHCIYITYKFSHRNWLNFIPLFQFRIMKTCIKCYLVMSSSFCFLLFWPPCIYYT